MYVTDTLDCVLERFLTKLRRSASANGELVQITADGAAVLYDGAQIRVWTMAQIARGIAY